MRTKFILNSYHSKYMFESWTYSIKFLSSSESNHTTKLKQKKIEKRHISTKKGAVSISNTKPSSH